MLKSIVRGFRSVLRFSGRDTRSEFWPYAGTVVVLYAVIWVTVSTSIFSDSRANDSQATQEMFFALVIVAFVALLAAAVSRRLHDGGASGYWGLLPLAFAIFTEAGFDLDEPQFKVGKLGVVLFFSIFASGALYMAAMIWLIVLLARRSAPGPNRYG